jgi:hypothetical protein
MKFAAKGLVNSQKRPLSVTCDCGVNQLSPVGAFSDPLMLQKMKKKKKKKKKKKMPQSQL